MNTEIIYALGTIVVVLAINWVIISGFLTGALWISAGWKERSLHLSTALLAGILFTGVGGPDVFILCWWATGVISGGVCVVLYHCLHRKESCSQ